MTSSSRPGAVVKAFIGGWQRLWFEQIPADSYTLLRITFGVLGLLDLLGATPVSMFWPADGLVPLPGGGLGFRALLSSLGLGTVFGVGLFSCLAIAFAAMALGVFTSWAVPCCFIGSVIQQAWNPLPLSSAHAVLATVLFCLVWADCSGAPSVDAWRSARRLARAPSREPQSMIWPLRLIRLQIALVYLNSGLWKLTNDVWRDGTAVHYVLDLNVFHRFPYHVPPSLDWTLVVATYFTLVWEIGFAFMLFNRWTRRIALGAGLLLHAGLWATLEIGPFSWLMIASYLAFLDPHWVSRMVRQRITRSSMGPLQPLDFSPNVPASHDSARA